MPDINWAKSTIISYLYKGMKDGESIRFSGEGDQKPGFESGDMIIVLDETSHNTFHHHDNDDLIMEMSIDLVEALCVSGEQLKRLIRECCF